MLHPQFKFWSLQPFNFSLQKAATKSTKSFQLSTQIRLLQYPKFRLCTCRPSTLPRICRIPNSNFVFVALQLITSKIRYCVKEITKLSTHKKMVEPQIKKILRLPLYESLLQKAAITPKNNSAFVESQNQILFFSPFYLNGRH